VVESIAFLIAINFDLMRQRAGAQEATLLGAAALADPALIGGTQLHPLQATAPPRFEAGRLAPAARFALASRRTRFESALSH
jgi:hypothetical protein